MKHDLFPADELEPGQMRAVQVDRVALVVVRGADGRFHALRDRCPHQAGPLSRGYLRPMVVGDDVGQFQFLADKEVLHCPWHGFEYDLDTGRCPGDPETMRVRVYDVGIENGRLYVER